MVGQLMSKKICTECKHKVDQSETNWGTSYHCSYGFEMSTPSKVHGGSYQKYAWVSCCITRSKLWGYLFGTCCNEGKYFEKKEK